jgi:hypothetical protein
MSARHRCAADNGFFGLCVRLLCPAGNTMIEDTIDNMAANPGAAADPHARPMRFADRSAAIRKPDLKFSE